MRNGSTTRSTTPTTVSTTTGELTSQAVYINHNKILLTGGSNEASVFSLDLNNFKISLKKPMKYARNSHGIIFHKNRVFVLGGYNHKEKDCTTKCEVYDVELDRWNLIKDMNKKRLNFGVCFLYNE